MAWPRMVSHMNEAATDVAKEVPLSVREANARAAWITKKALWTQKPPSREDCLRPLEAIHRERYRSQHRSKR